MENLKTKVGIILYGIVGIFCLYLIFIFSFWIISKNKIYSGVSIAGINLDGKTKNEAQQLLTERVTQYQKSSIILGDKNPIKIKPLKLDLKFEVERTVDRAISFGADNPFNYGKKTNLPLEITFSETKLFSVLQNVNTDLQVIPKDASVSLSDGNFTVVSGVVGKSLNYAETTAQFIDAAGNLKNKVPAALVKIEPTFKGEDIKQYLSVLKSISENTLKLRGAGYTFTVSSNQIAGWIRPVKQEPMGSIFYGGDILSALDNTSGSGIFSDILISDYIDGIGEKINRKSVNARLTISGGKATVFVASRSGKTLDVPVSVENIIKALQSGQKEAELVINTISAEVSEGSLNDLGIKELLATGYSNFAGSPPNRVHNVRTGASKFNGVLIKPGEEFSFNKTLGKVDASTGYLPELVILENKTTPEYGGGMCQVSSTAFRAALNAGLPILERLYHAYPVVYYTPYGVDATVYLPKPDLVFENDTGHYILIQTHIEGTRLTFDFYGTKPKRTVKFAGNENAKGAVYPVERVTPLIYDFGARGKNSFTAVFWRFIYNANGKLIRKSNWVSKYDSPDKFPH